MDEPSAGRQRGGIHVCHSQNEHAGVVSDFVLRFSEHAVERMLEWDLDVADVRSAIDTGETIEEYEDGSWLILGRAELRPLHIVASDSGRSDTITVVTVYEPDPRRWDPALRRRRSR